MNARQIVNRLITVEMDAQTEPDMRRVLRDERRSEADVTLTEVDG